MNFRVPEDEKEEFRDYCEKRNLTLSDGLRRAFRIGYSEMRDESRPDKSGQPSGHAAEDDDRPDLRDVFVSLGTVRGSLKTVLFGAVFVLFFVGISIAFPDWSEATPLVPQVYALIGFLLFGVGACGFLVGALRLIWKQLRPLLSRLKESFATERRGKGS